MFYFGLNVKKRVMKTFEKWMTEVLVRSSNLLCINTAYNGGDLLPQKLVLA
jgi:hypothetical protein